MPTAPRSVILNTRAPRTEVTGGLENSNAGRGCGFYAVVGLLSLVRSDMCAGTVVHNVELPRTTPYSLLRRGRVMTRRLRVIPTWSEPLEGLRLRPR